MKNKFSLNFCSLIINWAHFSFICHFYFILCSRDNYNFQYILYCFPTFIHNINSSNRGKPFGYVLKSEVVSEIITTAYKTLKFWSRVKWTKKSGYCEIWLDCRLFWKDHHQLKISHLVKIFPHRLSNRRYYNSISYSILCLLNNFIDDLFFNFCIISKLTLCLWLRIGHEHYSTKDAV